MSDGRRRAGTLVASIALLAAACTATEATPEPTEQPTATKQPSEAPSATVEPTTAPSEAATPQASEAPTSAVAFTWTTAPNPLPAEMQSVIADGNRFVAVGTDGSGQVAFTSTDGASWQQQTVPPPTGLVDPNDGLPADIEARSSVMGPLVRLDDTLYSFGSFCFLDQCRPTAWRLTDGQGWAFVSSSNPFFGEGRPWAVGSGGGALVVARLGPGITFSGADSTVWSWRPATSWVASDLDAADPRHVLVSGLAWQGGSFMATGHVTTGDENGPIQTTAWSSTDGGAWTEVAPPTTNGVLCGLRADPDGDDFLAVGVETAKVTAWSWSASGGWSGVDLPDATGVPTTQGGPHAGTCAIVEVAGQTVAVFGPMSGAVQTWTRAGSSWLTGAPTQITTTSGIGALVAAQGGRLIVLESVFNQATLVTTTTVHIGTAQP